MTRNKIKYPWIKILIALLVIIFTCVLVSQAQSNQIWETRQFFKDSTQVESKKGGTKWEVEMYWEDIAIELKKIDTIPYITDFWGEYKDPKKYGGLIQIDQDMSLEDIVKKLPIGSKVELASFVSNPNHREMIKGKKVIALGDILEHEVWKRNEQKIGASTNTQSIIFEPTIKKWIIPQESGSKIITSQMIGIVKLSELFYLSEEKIEYDGFFFPYKVIQKGTWIFITSNQLP